MSDEKQEGVDFGAYLREERIKAGWTLRKLAEEIGVSPTYLSGIENNTLPPPTMERLDKISSTLGTPIDLLIEKADRWDDLAKQRVDDRPDFVKLFRVVKDFTPDQIEQVTKAAEEMVNEGEK